MKLARGKRAAVTCLGIFLGFMAVCTVVAKGIYASGLPRVNSVKPYSTGISHEIKVNATVRQGQEYGIYVAEGLRVALVAVGKGDTFETGQALFQIETGDLENIMAEYRLALAKLEARQSDAAKAKRTDSQERKLQVSRAKEDYEDVLAAADARIQSCLQDLEIAQAALTRYDRYLAEASAAEKNESSNEEQGDASGGSIGKAYDYEKAYAEQEKRAQIVQTVVAYATALADAEREKEVSLRAAARKLEDAEASAKNTGGSLDTELLALDVEQQKKQLEEFEELLAADGWIYAPSAGRVTDCRLAVGERTRDEAEILYARDEGDKILEVFFSEDEVKYLSEGTEFTITSARSNGTKEAGKILLEYLEKQEGGESYGRFSIGGANPFAKGDESAEGEEEQSEGGAETYVGELQLSIGQTVELSYQTQSTIYYTCIPKECIYQEGENRYYVYIAEEKEGILGTEWRVRKVNVTILDENDTVAAIQSAEISTESRVVSASDKALADGNVVRVL